MVDENEIKSAKLTASILSDLNSACKLHPAQIEIGKAIFIDGKKLIVAECGRKFGKSELVCYVLFRYAMMNPGSFNYYVAPFQNMIADIIWKNNRLPGYLPDHIAKKYILSINNTEMRIMLKNGSFIKCLGSDNYNASRGYSATGVAVYDEGKDINPQFHNAFEPNLAITDAPLLVVGTPAYEDENLFTRMGESARAIESGAYFNFPSHVNPHISAEYLKRKELELKEKGEFDVFQVEYLAKRVKIGKKYIFPMLKKSMVKDHSELMEHINANRKDYDFYTGYDPGSAKCFAVGMFAIHRFDKHIIALDEIYATKLGENSVRQIIPMALSKFKEINPNEDDWMDCYDYAAAWFASEIAYEYEDYPHPLFPCQKDLKNKEGKLSLIKDILINNLFTFSDRVAKGYWEMDNYKVDEKGKLIKENDHWIDLFRYVLNLANYSTVEGARPLEFHQKHKTGTIRQDIERQQQEDGYGYIDNYIYGD